MNARVVWILVALTLVAGYVDAVAFFGMGVFTANMTGNTVLLGGAIAARFVAPLPGSIGLILPAVSIGCFAAGGVVAAVALRGRVPAFPASRRPSSPGRWFARFSISPARRKPARRCGRKAAPTPPCGRAIWWAAAGGAAALHALGSGALWPAAGVVALLLPMV